MKWNKNRIEMKTASAFLLKASCSTFITHSLSWRREARMGNVTKNHSHPPVDEKVKFLFKRFSKTILS